MCTCVGILLTLNPWSLLSIDMSDLQVLTDYQGWPLVFLLFTVGVATKPIKPSTGVLSDINPLSILIQMIKWYRITEKDLVTEPYLVTEPHSLTEPHSVTESHSITEPHPVTEPHSVTDLQ